MEFVRYIHARLPHPGIPESFEILKQESHVACMRGEKMDSGLEADLHVIVKL